MDNMFLQTMHAAKQNLRLSFDEWRPASDIRIERFKYSIITQKPPMFTEW
jgi:hypothetical protein